MQTMPTMTTTQPQSQQPLQPHTQLLPPIQLKPKTQANKAQPTKSGKVSPPCPPCSPVKASFVPTSPTPVPTPTLSFRDAFTPPSPPSRDSLASPFSPLSSTLPAFHGLPGLVRPNPPRPSLSMLSFTVAMGSSVDVDPLCEVKLKQIDQYAW